MKIKIVLLIIILNVLAITVAFSQDKEPLFYIKIYGGYGIFTPGSDGLYPGAVLGVQNGTTGSYSYSKHGLGAGFNNGFGIEKTLGRVFTIGIDFNTLHGKTLSSSYTNHPPSSTEINFITYDGTVAYSVISFIPNVSAKVFHNSYYYVYTRLGVIIDKKISYQNTENYTIVGNGTLPNIEDYIQVNKYGLNFGLNAAVGIRVKLLGPLKGTFEISNSLLPASPTSATAHINITQGYGSGVIDDNITYIKPNSGTTTSQSVVATGSETINETQPSFTQHINNIVLNIGLALAIK